MFSKRFLFLQVFLFLVLGSLLFTVYRQKMSVPALPVLGQVSHFSLDNSDGLKTSLEDLKGKVWVADFVFTTCGSICPMMTKHMNVLHRSFHDNDDVRLLSISVNPENDSPEVLNQFARKYKADTKHWFFLTGSREEITKIVVESFKLGDIKDPIFHSS